MQNSELNRNCDYCCGSSPAHPGEGIRIDLDDLAAGHAVHQYPSEQWHRVKSVDQRPGVEPRNDPGVA
jgi:hypothetical protein